MSHLSPLDSAHSSHNQPDLQVFRLEHEPLSSATDVFAVKLTDEIYTALVAAEKKGTCISVKVDEQGNGTWHLGDSVFRFQKNQIESNRIDSCVYNPQASAYQSCGSVRTKFQIQATDKSFDATRERTASKLAEVKANMTKVVGKKEPSGASRYLSSSHSLQQRTTGSSPFSASSPFSHPNRNSPIPPKTSPKFSSASNHSGTTTNHGSSLTIDPLRHELQKKNLRKRVIHLIATGQHRNWREVYNRLEEDGLSDEQKSKSRIEAMVGEVSELQASTQPNRSSRLALKPSFYSELDTRWKWYNEEEKATVRKLVASGMSHTTATDDAFAPVRKSHVERVQFGNRSDREKPPSRLVSPDAIPTPPTGGVHKPATSNSTTLDKDSSTAFNAIGESSFDDSDFVSTSQPAKRKAHVANANANASSTASASASTSLAPPTKRSRPEARPESASPPEDPTITIESRHQQPVPLQRQIVEKQTKAHMQAARKKKPLPPPSSVSGGSSSSSSSSRTQSPTFFASPPEPSRDWDKVFTEAKTVKDAEEYYTKFQADYPEYMKCYGRLRQVTNEFREFEKRHKQAQRHGNQAQLNAIEKQIQDRFNCLERDEDFIEARRRHSDLRAKLTVLKMRITDWERTRRGP